MKPTSAPTSASAAEILPGTPYVDPNRVESARNMSVGLGGTTIAILTFTLFFLFPLDNAGRIDNVLFHGTLAVDILALFSFGFASLYYSRLVTDLLREDPRARGHLLAGNLFLQGGLGFLSVTPALILFTIGIYDIAILALALWLLLLASVFRSRADYEPTQL